MKGVCNTGLFLDKEWRRDPFSVFLFFLSFTQYRQHFFLYRKYQMISTNSMIVDNSNKIIQPDIDPMLMGYGPIPEEQIQSSDILMENAAVPG